MQDIGYATPVGDETHRLRIATALPETPRLHVIQAELRIAGWEEGLDTWVTIP